VRPVGRELYPRQTPSGCIWLAAAGGLAMA
jgi:hypothetical protein